MKTITLSPEKNKLLFTLRSDGVKAACYKFDPLNLKQQQQVARDAGVKVDAVLSWIEQTGQVSREFTLEPPKQTGATLVVRKIDQPRDKGDTHELSTWQAHVALGSDTLLDWTDQNELCCLDIDYHAGKVPTAEWVETTVVARLVPRPVCWHLSRGGGVHCFYRRSGALTAKEIAALAAIRWRAIDPTAGVELKSQVRAAGDKPVYTPPGYDTANSFVTEWVGVQPLGADDDKVLSYLDGQGLSVGGRYPHTACPIDPTDDPSLRDPVVVGDDGLYCHRCAGKGLPGKGSTKPGFCPWHGLLGIETAGVMRTMVVNRTHWGHAKWVVEAAYGLTGEIARLGYSAALKLYHGMSELPGVFHPDTDVLVRFHGRWGTVVEGYTFPKDGIKPLLQALPVAQDDDGKPMAARVTRLEQPSLDHTDLGYPGIEVIRGLKIAGHRNAYRDASRLVVATPAPWLRPYESAYYPRYRKGNVHDAERLLEDDFPGINWGYVRALICARGCREARIGKPQHILVTGGSGAGKSGHVHLTAGLLGEVVTPAPYGKDLDRFRSSIRDGSAAGGFVTVDEFLKDSIRQNYGLTPEQTMDPLLNLTPDSVSHKLYVGPSAMGQLAVMVWTETWIPEALRDHLQIARRVHYLKLTRRVNWEPGLAKYGMDRLELVRTISPDHAQACDVIVSDVIDRYFQVLVPFEQLAPEFGITTLEASPDFVDPSEKLLRFFALVCEAPELDVVSARKCKGRGFKVITAADDTELMELWQDFADGARGRGFRQSTKLAAEDWGSRLGVSEPVHIDIHPDASHRVFVRFRIGSVARPEKINAEITNVPSGKDDARVP